MKIKGIFLSSVLLLGNSAVSMDSPKDSLPQNSSRLSISERRKFTEHKIKLQKEKEYKKDQEKKNNQEEKRISKLDYKTEWEVYEWLVGRTSDENIKNSILKNDIKIEEYYHNKDNAIYITTLDNKPERLEIVLKAIKEHATKVKLLELLAEKDSANMDVVENAKHFGYQDCINLINKYK